MKLEKANKEVASQSLAVMPVHQPRAGGFSKKPAVVARTVVGKVQAAQPCHHQPRWLTQVHASKCDISHANFQARQLFES